jgi:hypothetical protein
VILDLLVGLAARLKARAKDPKLRNREILDPAVEPLAGCQIVEVSSGVAVVRPTGTLAAAELVRWLVRANGALRKVRFEGVAFAETVDLSYLKLEVRLEFVDCALPDGIQLAHAELPSLLFDRCSIGGLPYGPGDGPGFELLKDGRIRGKYESISAYGAHLRSGLDLVRSSLSGQIDLWQAQVGGSVYLTDSSVGQIETVPNGVPPSRWLDAVEAYSASLYAVAAEIGGDLIIEGDETILAGGIVLRGTNFKGVVSIQAGAEIGLLHNGASIEVDVATIDGQIAITGENTRALGDVLVRDSSIRTDLTVSAGAGIGSAGRPANLVVDGATIDRIRLDGAGTEITGQVLVSKSRLGRLQISPDTTIGGVAELGRDALRVDGGTIAEVDIADFSGGNRIAFLDLDVEHFVFRERTWTRPRSWVLDLSQLTRIVTPNGTCDPNQLRQWVADMDADGREGAKSVMYERLIGALRAAGLHEDVSALVAEKRKLDWPAWTRWLFSPFGLELRTTRIAAVFVGAFVVTLALVAVGAQNGLFIATVDVYQLSASAQDVNPNDRTESPSTEADAGTSTAIVSSADGRCGAGDYPCLEPVAYTIDVLFPVIDLGAERYWAVATTERFGSWANAVHLSLVAARLLGWMCLGMFVFTTYERLAYRREH